MVGVTLRSRLPASPVGVMTATPESRRPGQGTAEAVAPPTQVAVPRWLSGVTKTARPAAYAGFMNPGSSPSPRTGRSATAMRQLAGVVAVGVTRPPAPRPRWLMRGRVDLVAVTDVIVALICFGATNSTLSNRHPVNASAVVILVISLALCAPLAARTYFPLTAWCASALALFWVGGAFSPMGVLPGGILVYILCLYAVAVRCESWVVATAGVATVIGGMFIYEIGRAHV